MFTKNTKNIIESETVCYKKASEVADLLITELGRFFREGKLDCSVPLANPNLAGDCLKSHFVKAFPSKGRNRPDEVSICIKATLSTESGSYKEFSSDVAWIKPLTEGHFKIEILDKSMHQVFKGTEEKLFFKLESVISEKQAELSISTWAFEPEGDCEAALRK